MRFKLLIFIALGTTAAIAVVGFFWQRCDKDSRISFLPSFSRGEWIMYPKPPDLHVQPAVEQPCIFQKSFVIKEIPFSAKLVVRAFRRCVVCVNGRYSNLPTGNWKEAHSLEIAPFLKTGENTLRIIVFNQAGPPALWVNLSAGEVFICSNEEWQSSFAGAVWRATTRANQTIVAGHGNELWGNEKSLPAFGNSWLSLGGLALAASLVIAGLGRWPMALDNWRNHLRWQWIRHPPSALLVATGLLWVILFTHNLSFLPKTAGFDSEGHLKYIEYIQTHKKLPLANEGWEMHQPPLYYIAASLTLDCLGLTPTSFDGISVLRLMSLLIGLAHLLVVSQTLRLLFPDRIGAQSAGLFLAGFLPMQLYLTHFITNEAPAACLMSLTLLTVIRILRCPKVSCKLALASGFCLGLALLTKVTALILVPFVSLALGYRAWSANLAAAKRRLLILGPLLVCAAVCGWHYARVWEHFGLPFVTGDTGDQSAWWQDPGYRTAPWFFRFGHALTEPFFAGLSGFGDGIYSTLWGDGLWSGYAARIARPPWNYQLMAASYILAVLPSLLLCLGLGLTVFKMIRRPEPISHLLVWVSFVLILALIQFNLMVPAYSSVKAFFLMSGLAPLAGFAGAGYEFISKRWPVVRRPAMALVIWWGLCSYVAFWIRTDSPVTMALMGREREREGNHQAAASYFKAALLRHSAGPEALSFQTSALLGSGQYSEAATMATKLIKEHPEEPLGHLYLASTLERQGKMEAALEETLLATSVAPDNRSARLNLASRLYRMGRLDASIEAAREALRISPLDADIHTLLGRALLGRASQPDAPLGLAGDEDIWPVNKESLDVNDMLAAEAINHFRFVVRLNPDSAQSLDELAWNLATDSNTKLRDGHEAVQLAEKACLMTQFKNSGMLETLAVARAEAGQYETALQILKSIEKLSDASNAPTIQNKYESLKRLFAARKPYHRPRINVKPIEN